MSNDTRYSSTPRVVLHTGAYRTIMEASRAAMPGETVGLLYGSARRTNTDQLWVTVKEAAAVEIVVVRGNAMEMRPNSLKALLDRAGVEGEESDGHEVVGWFYADPGTGVFSPRLSIPDTQRSLPESASLFLLANPSTDQGAFYSWNGQQYVPTGGFYEAVPNESASPSVAWNGEVRGAADWLGSLLAEVPPDAISIQEDDIPAWTVPQKVAGTRGLPGEAVDGEALPEGDKFITSGRVPGGAEKPEPSSSVPVFVEVITEEPVEYLAPEEPIATGELGPQPASESETPEKGEDTMPYPILYDEAGRTEDTMPQPIPADAQAEGSEYDHGAHRGWNTAPFPGATQGSSDAGELSDTASEDSARRGDQPAPTAPLPPHAEAGQPQAESAEPERQEPV